MNSDAAMALIIAPPGRMRDSWYVLLRATRRLTTVLHADDGPGGLEIVAQHPIAWVLLDADLADDAWRTLAQLQAHWPGVRCLMLIHTTAQMRRALRFEHVGTLPVDCSLIQLQNEMRRVQAACERDGTS